MSDAARARAVLRYQTLYRRKILCFRLLYEFTFNQCGECVNSGCACKDRICQHVEEQALRRGARFPHTGHALRFIGYKDEMGRIHSRIPEDASPDVIAGASTRIADSVPKPACLGCIVPPHLRETCTIYLCEPAQKRPDFDRPRYDRLRALGAKIEMQLMELEESFGADYLMARSTPEPRLELRTEAN